MSDTIRTLKRRLRPLRPVLLPIWRRVGPWLTRPHVWPWTRVRWALEARQRRRLRRQGRIRAITGSEFDAIVAGHPYYRGRRRYMLAAAAEADALIRARGLRTALELGPHLRPLIVGSDVMDLRVNADLDAEGTVFAHDATVTPWPVERTYDLFVALQVFEHLGTSQAQVFREVSRVARNAIISLPIDWVKADPTDIHHGITNERVLGWFEPRVPTRIVVGNPGPGKRLLYIFEGLDAAPQPATLASEPAPVV